MRLVWMKWLDAKGDFRRRVTLEELREETPCVCTSVGWVVEEPEHEGVGPEVERFWILTPHLRVDREERPAVERAQDGAIVIPAGSVVAVRDLLREPLGGLERAQAEGFEGAMERAHDSASDESFGEKEANDAE